MCEVWHYDDGDPTTVWSARRIARARKAHRCSSCSTTIAIGASYWRRFWATTSDTSDEPCCDACWEIAEAFGKEHMFTPNPATLLEFLDDCVDQGDEGSQRWRVAADAIRERRYACPRP